MVNPSALAVFRLMTNSNFVGCSTGRSAGLAPFKILSTKTAARRQISMMIRAIGDQPAGLDIEPEAIYGGEPALGGQLCDPPGLLFEERARDHEESPRTGGSRRLERALNLTRVSNLERHQLPPPLDERRIRAACHDIREDSGRSRRTATGDAARDELLEQLESLPGRLRRPEDSTP